MYLLYTMTFMVTHLSIYYDFFSLPLAKKTLQKTKAINCAVIQSSSSTCQTSKTKTFESFFFFYSLCFNFTTDALVNAFLN